MLNGWKHGLAVDLGTSNTCVYAPGRGVVVNEPSIVAINDKGGIEAVGVAAKEMLGMTPGNIKVVKPMRSGAIADFEVVEKMLSHFIKKARQNAWTRPRVIVGVQSEITPVERRAVEDSIMHARASEVHLVEETIAAAIGAGIRMDEATGNMIVDIGGGTADIAVISLAGIVYSRSLRVAGNQMDEAIIQYVRRRHNLLIGERTAEGVKIGIGCAVLPAETRVMKVKGRDLTSGLPKTISLTSEEVFEALVDTLKAIVQAVRDALEQIPPELSADICDRGIVLTGGGSLLRNLDVRLGTETTQRFVVADDPAMSVVLGAGRLLTDTNLRNLVFSEERRVPKGNVSLE